MILDLYPTDFSPGTHRFQLCSPFSSQVEMASDYNKNPNCSDETSVTLITPGIIIYTSHYSSLMHTCLPIHTDNNWIITWIAVGIVGLLVLGIIAIIITTIVRKYRKRPPLQVGPSPIGFQSRVAQTPLTCDERRSEETPLLKDDPKEEYHSQQQTG